MSFGVKVVIVVIAHLGELVVRVICHVDSYRKNYVCNWIFRFFTFHFSLFTFRFSLLTFHFRKTHYVAIVPADLRSAGIEYQDLLIRLKYHLFK